MGEETVPEQAPAVESEDPRRSRPVHTWALILVGLVATAIGIALGWAIDWFPVRGATQAKPIDTLYHVLIVASVPFFVLVAAVTLYCVWQFRERPGEEGLDGPSIHGNTGLEVVWTAIPAILLIGLCTYAYVVLTDIEAAPAAGEPKELVVNVTGQQFAWTFEYPQAKVKSAELVLPEGRSVQFKVKSLDVIHDFWVPEFRMKIDAVPGITTSYRVTPNRTGSYAIVCAELCGVGHALMRQKVSVVSEARFAAWIERKQNGGAAAGGGAADRNAGGESRQAAIGKTIFAEGNGEATACGACHALSDAGTSGAAGPNLDDVLDGWSTAEITEAIVDPNKEIAEGYAAGVMPATYGDALTKPELEALVAYLEQTAAK